MPVFRFHLVADPVVFVANPYEFVYSLRVLLTFHEIETDWLRRWPEAPLAGSRRPGRSFLHVLIGDHSRSLHLALASLTRCSGVPSLEPKC
jgi:hypothetical protein